ncbi:succinate dehydrogenase [Bordetella genomosp. 11]|uniref:Succinate dehydrogenase n=1 Tax=Bordetella genomosp. 11 TaxID=1416808 RepID=A0A261UC89_9BORD|nr:succinate dehydrogenase [Bordetella genomosp. 11]OZI59558.1 succinate dehydrogenase [Bordetella genomosp. 11]
MAAMGVRTQARLWYYQRVSAMVLALFVAVHIGIIVYAVRGGLTGAEILARTQGSIGFAIFYGVFVLACAVHVPIGLLRIAEEWLRWRGPPAVAAALAFALVLAVMGLRAVYGVVA